jgi:DMSO/TMAO reductase YedYZ molybdopterin-dependent catalytic subunit
MTSETDRSRPFFGAVAGLLAGLVAVGVGQFAASLGALGSAPVYAVGEAAIGLTPPAVKDFAISTFGTNDKTALLTGIYIVLGLYAIVVGLLATRRRWYGFAGLAAFAVVGLVAAATRPGANAGWLVPTIAAAAASAIVLLLLLRMIPAAGREPSSARSGTMGGSSGDGQGAAGTRAVADREPGAVPPDAAPLTDGRDAGAKSPAGASSAGEQAAASGDVVGGQWVPGSPPTPRPASAPPGGSRRQFLVTGTTAAGIAAVGLVAGRLLGERGAVTQARSALKLPRPRAVIGDRLPPGTDFRIPGLSPFITPNATFYRVDTALILPQVPPSGWRLRIHGMVDREIDLSFDDLMRRPLIETYVTLTCVSDPVAGPYIGNARWLGASLASLLREARPRAGADQILSTSADGYTSGTPVQTVLDGRDALLAVAMNGVPLPVEHGFPVRMVVPGLYGYVSATKWVTDLKLTTFGAETAYWAQRGWTQQAPIKTESRIDVPLTGTTRRAGRTPVAGVAWAQHKGIDAVHVRVDRGPWHQATLAAVPGIDTWRQWVWQWDATPGLHVIEARATDGTGYTQTALQAPPPPNGASGYPAIQIKIN